MTAFLGNTVAHLEEVCTAAVTNMPGSKNGSSLSIWAWIAMVLSESTVFAMRCMLPVLILVSLLGKWNVIFCPIVS